jgi:hypothetical protein
VGEVVLVMRTHAATRLVERYGVRQDAEHVVAIVRAKILTGDAKFLNHAHRGRSAWLVYAAGRRLRVIWEESTKEVVTVLPARRGWRGKAKREAAGETEGGT